MAVTVETLDKLERRLTLTLHPDLITKEVTSRLKKISRTVKADGFRPGKVPMNVVIKRYGPSVQQEVMDDQINEALINAITESQLNIAGIVQIAKKETETETETETATDEKKWAFDVIVEVYPEVQLGDLTALEIEHVATTLPDSAIDKTIDIMRKQACTFFERPAGEPATEGDRVTVDFEGKIDGASFEGGKAENFQFVIGENSMPEAFEKAVRGMKQGESKTFLLQFPDTFKNETVAGKEADFLVTLHKLEAANLPALDEAFIQSLGVTEGSIEALRTEIRQNLDRQMNFRLATRNQNTIVETLLNTIELDVPKSLVESELKAMISDAREHRETINTKGSNPDDAPNIATKTFQTRAERRVRLSLIASELARQHQLHPTREQIENKLPEILNHFKNSDLFPNLPLNSEEISSQLKSILMLENVIDFVLSKAKVIHKEISFEDL